MARLAGVSAALTAVALATPRAALAQPPGNQTEAQAIQGQIAELRREFETRMAALEARLAAIEAGTAPAGAQAGAQPTAAVPAGAQGADGPQGALPIYGNAEATSKIFNPDIAVIGNFVGAAGTNDVRPEPPLEMREAETSFQAVVDPYARADFFMAFGQEGVDLEEGYLTLTALPGAVLGRVGKMRAAFGKVNTFHTHQLPWADRPLVTENLLGGEEGISDAGVSAAHLVTNPWVFLEATGQVFRGEAGDVFAAPTRSDLLYLGHLRGYRDLTEATNVDLGLSYAHGHNGSGFDDPTVDAGRFTSDLVGIDATVRWRPLRRSIYHSFVGRSEIVWSRREQPDGLQKANGFYVSGDYQVARRWFAGARLDRSDRAGDSSIRDTGQSLLVTYWPSEFSQVRGQYRRTAYGDGPTAHEMLFQFQFSIGAHGAHPF